MKKMLFAIAIVMLAVSCGGNETPTPKPPTSKYKKHAGEGEIKIMSFNVRTSGMDKDTPNHWDNRKEAVLALIKDQMPDIMGVQEATFTSQWLWLKDKLKSAGYDGYGLNRQTGKESGSGECPGILWNGNVIKKIEVGTFWLSETPDTPSKGWDANYYRTATWGLFEHIATGQIFFMVNTHLDHESITAQVEGMKLIEQKLLEYEWDYPLYLTGDFNVISTDKALDGVREFMRNARTYATVRDTNPTVNGFGSSSSRKQIDHIYYSDYLKAVEYYTIMDAYNGVTYVSDHYPIYAIIKLKK
jgi:endonuclease/exonuclease/phosphatase family metal-dependent hydrolase